MRLCLKDLDRMWPDLQELDLWDLREHCSQGWTVELHLVRLCLKDLDRMWPDLQELNLWDLREHCSQG